MKGRILDYSVGINRKQRITLELDSDFREGFENLKTEELDIRIAKWRSKRSNNANSYFHVLVNEIAMATGDSDEDVKRRLVVEYGSVARDIHGDMVGFKLPSKVDVDEIYPYTRWYKDVTENGKEFSCYIVYKRSSDMDTKEMSHLIEGTIREAQSLNIDTDTPDKAAWWKELKGE